MPPSSPEQSYTPESNVPNPPERYMEIERGDVNQFPTDQTSTNQQNNTPTQPQANQPSSPPPQNNIDPVEIVKNMISSGFTPTRAQIMNANQYMSGPNDSSNTWFAIFLQRLLKQQKKKKKQQAKR